MTTSSSKIHLSYSFKKQRHGGSPRAVGYHTCAHTRACTHPHTHTTPGPTTSIKSLVIMLQLTAAHFPYATAKQ